MGALIRVGIFSLTIVGINATAWANNREAWHVTGDIAGKRFTMDCTFDVGGAKLGGQCIGKADGEREAKTFRLTRGSVAGQRMQWTYQARAMFMSIDVSFAGTVSGDRMSGVTRAAGRSGSFTAYRA